MENEVQVHVSIIYLQLVTLIHIKTLKIVDIPKEHDKLTTVLSKNLYLCSKIEMMDGH